MQSNKIATPLWDLRGYSDEVYEPAEDSFLLLDTLEEELEVIRSFNPLTILEIGPGSGVIISALAHLFRSSFCLAIDINPFACQATQKTANLNNVSVSVVQSDLVSGLRLPATQIDLLLFNPPYVPSEPGEEERGLLDRAWAGGRQGGSALTLRLFPELEQLMSARCLGYIVALEENNPPQMCSKLNQLGFKTSIVKKRKIIGEKLSVIKFYRD